MAITREWIKQFPRLSAGKSIGAKSASIYSPVTHESLTIAALLPSGRDAVMLHRIAQKYGWQLFTAHSWDRAKEVIQQYKTGVVIVDQQLLHSDWQQSFRALFDTPQKFCVVLLSLDGSDAFWEEAIRQGAYEVLTTPVKKAVIRETVEFAWKFWKSCIARTPKEV